MLGNLNAEASARQFADTKLQENMFNEEVARKAADDALDARLDALEQP
jgi:hypothetical protein